MEPNGKKLKPTFSVSVRTPETDPSGPGYAYASTHVPYPEVTSRDYSLRIVQPDGMNIFHNVSFSIEADISVYTGPPGDPLIQFELLDQVHAGTHIMKWTSDKKGILLTGNRKLSVFDGSEKAVLTAGPGGCSWLRIPAEKRVLGWSSSYRTWHWHSVEKRPDPCEAIDIEASS